jgi:hypothetical protein
VAPPTLNPGTTWRREVLFVLQSSLLLALIGFEARRSQGHGAEYKSRSVKRLALHFIRFTVLVELLFNETENPIMNFKISVLNNVQCLKLNLKLHKVSEAENTCIIR